MPDRHHQIWTRRTLLAAGCMIASPSEQRPGDPRSYRVSLSGSSAWGGLLRAARALDKQGERRRRIKSATRPTSSCHLLRCSPGRDERGLTEKLVTGDTSFLLGPSLGHRDRTAVISER